MAKVLLIVPPFWDPVCVPLGISSLKAYVDKFGHHTDLFDFNTCPEIFGAQRLYFEEGKRQFPYWKNWYIEGNGAEMLALHQILYLYARPKPNYRELIAEVLNMSGRPLDAFIDELDVSRFDMIFSALYRETSVVLERLLLKTRPDVVGCYLGNSTWPASLFILKRVKELMPRIRTVVGGPGPIMGIFSNADEIQNFFDRHDFLDYYVIGEGEESLLKILETPDLPQGIIDPGRGLTLDEIKKTSLKMNELPLPDYGDLEISKYLQLSISSSRGCPFECAFCSEAVFWKGFRKIDRSSMFARLDVLAKRYNRISFFICDSLTNHIITPLTSDIASSGKPYKLDCYLRADPICTDERRTRVWREGGLFRARLGLESASQRILDAMVKKTNPENMAKSLQALASQGIMTTTLWIIGFPGETESEFHSALSFIRDNSSHIYQADAKVFQYHPEGMAHSKEIDTARGSRYRFSAEINDILAVTPYIVDKDLSTAERFERLERFVSEMRRLGIPNTYTIFDWVTAERRWKSLGHDSDWNPRKSMMTLKG